MSKRYRKPIQRNNAATIERGRAGNVYYGSQGIQGNYGYGGNGKGSTVTIPANIVATMLKNMAPQKNQSHDFAPGSPLRPYEGVVPLGGPRQWSYGVGVNLTNNDRTEGHADIPSFAQLRSFAQLYDGVGICERVILDMIPKLEPHVTLRKHLSEQGAKEKDFQQEISLWTKLLEKPSPGQNLDIHSWLRMAWTEQTQIDALSIFKHKNRGGGLYGLEIVDGSTIKPILNERGMVPDAAQGFPAYQQYPYGVPGDLYTADNLFYYRESPRAFSGYGFSRIERVITRINQALRKEQKDLAYFTEGNLPLGIMQVPEASTWTPDQIDAYEQAWNALIAGNQQQQVRTKFTQPGMEYIPIDQYPLDPIFDRFILNHLTAAYGLSMGDISFTEDIHKSSGDTQQNMMYRRTLSPFITTYAWILTHAFSEAFHEDRFVVTFGGYQEHEDLNMQADGYQKFISIGAISPASVARLMKFPAIPETGPVFITNQGITPLSNFEEGTPLRQQHETLAAAGHDASALLPETLQDAKNGASSEETPKTLPLAKNTAESDSDDDTERSSMTLVERQLAELLERVEVMNSALVRYNPAHDTATGQFGTYKQGQQLASVDEEKDEEETHTGMMVAFMLKPEEAKQLALPDGEPANQLHLTLAYLGDSREIALDERTVRRELASLASESLPLMGTTGGLARFAPSESSDNQSPIVALVNVPGLSKFREALVKRLESIGVQVANDFDFLAHITLKYIPADADMPLESIPTVSFTFDTVCLAIGDEHTYFKMGDEQYPQYWEEKAHEQRTQQNTENPQRVLASVGRGNQQTSSTAKGVGATELGEERLDREASWDGAIFDASREKRIDIRRWRSRAIEDIKHGRGLRGFTTTFIPEYEHALISAGLTRCSTVTDVKNVFEIVRVGLQEQESQRVSRMGECQCDVCRANDGKPVEDGKEPPFHEGCGCSVAEMARV